jgi:hypothetical protein
MKLSLCIIYKVSHHEDVWRNGGMVPYIFNLGTRWRLVGQLYALIVLPHEKEPSAPITNGY